MSQRKTVKHYHEPGDVHEFTFSCYRGMQLLIDDAWRIDLCQQFDRANELCQMKMIAFVLMPEHVHLLVYPMSSDPEIERYLSAIKRPYSYRIKRCLQETANSLLNLLTVQERPGKTAFRFWQEGPGFDRNLNQENAVLAAIDYIHMNPVRRGLVEQVRDWKWSSARWYESERQIKDSDLPTIHGLPPEFFTTGR